MTDATAIVVVAGVSGSGKSTIGAMLADRLGWSFADGDSFHSAANVAKMAAGTPLTDEDRRPWLAAIGTWMDERAAAGEFGVVACSALKRGYREVLLAGRPAARLVFLDVPRDVEVARLTARHGHFFPAMLAGTQFDDLEVPGTAEDALVITAVGTPAELVAAIIAGLRLGHAR
jgi:gluconokinase